MNEELYKENILDHYYHPRNKREMADFSAEGGGANPNCGDEIKLYLKFDGKKVGDISFTGQGCAISQASASMLTEKVKGESLDKIRTLTPGDIYTMLGVKISPGRTECALLPYEALNKAIKSYHG